MLNTTSPLVSSPKTIDQPITNTSSPISTSSPTHSTIIINSTPESSSTTSPTISHPTPSTKNTKKRSMDNASVEHQPSKKRKLTQLSKTATTIIDQHKSKVCKTYNNNQQKFKQWCEDKSIDYNTDPHIHIINFISDLYHVQKYSTSTIRVYSTAILQLYNKKTQQLIKNNENFINLLKAIDNNTIQPNKKWDYDIHPALHYISNLGNNSSLTTTLITIKSIWLLAMAGFLRPSDIARIDIDKNHIDNKGILHLLVIAPKEKRKGKHIHKRVAIHPHSNKLLCPVQAYQHYHNLIVDIPCYTPHPNFQNIRINRLYRYVNDLSMPLSKDRIAKYIREVMSKVIKEEGAPIPSARALAATLAAQAGISVDDIVAHGSWSSKDIFEHFYRISSYGSSNITEETLNEQLISRKAKCNMM